MTMGLHHPRGHSENRRGSIPCQTCDSRHTAPWALTGSQSGSGCWRTRHDGTSPHACILSGLAGNIVGLERPGASPLLTSFEIKGSMKGLESGPPMSGAPRTPHEVDLDLPVPDSVDDVVKYETFSRETSQQDSPIPDVSPEDITEIIINDDDDLDKTIENL